MRGARRLTLSEDGTRLVKRKWVTQEDSDPLLLIEGGIRKKPGEHLVTPHYWHPWVNAIRPNEPVYETRTKVRRDGTEYTQYRVRRKRKGCVRGTGPLVIRTEKMVAGVDDL